MALHCIANYYHLPNPLQAMVRQYCLYHSLDRYNVDILRSILNIYVFTALAFVSIFAAWRYWPVRIQVDKLERVETKVDVFDKMRCNGLQLTPAKFEKHFAMAQQLFWLEVKDFGVATCYYKTEINGVEYRIWDNGLGEVRRAGKVDFYTTRYNSQE